MSLQKNDNHSETKQRREETIKIESKNKYTLYNWETDYEFIHKH